MQRTVVLAAIALAALSCVGTAQVRVGKDSTTRLMRFGRDAAYGAAEGLAFAGVDQLTNSPAQWGKGWKGYEKRAASNVGEFLIQEGTTEGIAAIMKRPLDYTKCHCRNTGDRIGWAIKGAFTDQMPDGTHPLAVPRIVGAYVGSIAQASWRPDAASGRLRVGLINGTTSLAIGALINLFYEFR